MFFFLYIYIITFGTTVYTFAEFLNTHTHTHALTHLLFEQTALPNTRIIFYLFRLPFGGCFVGGGAHAVTRDPNKETF